jgi:hypothetical protein
MNQSSNAPLWISLAAFALWVVLQVQTPSPQVDPKRPEGPELYSAFSKNPNKIQAATDAAQFGELTASIAEMLLYDGQQTEPRIVTGVQLDDLRRWTRDYVTQGQKYQSRYPELAETIKAYLDQHAGKSGGPLDSHKRMAWSKCLTEIANNAKYAAARLAAE